MKKMTPGIWTGIYANLPLHEAFRTLHAQGWRAFEISTEHLALIEAGPESEKQTEQARSCLLELGLLAPQAHAHLAADVAAEDAANRGKDILLLQRHMRIASQLGAQNVVIHPGGKQGFTTRADQQRILARNVEAFRRLGDLAGELHMRIGLENLMHRAARPPELLDLLAAIDHPALGITIDTSHAHVVGLNLAEAVREWGSLLVATHISDNNGTADQHLTPGNGTIDWQAVMAAFHDIPYNGLFNLEIPGARHPVPAVQQLKLRYALETVNWLVTL